MDWIRNNMDRAIKDIISNLAAESYDDGWCDSNIDEPHDGPDYDAIDKVLKEIKDIFIERLEAYNKFLRKNGYADSDIDLETPTAIERFLSGDKE